jgi:predicted ATPase
MVEVKEVRIRGFRRLLDVELAPRPFQVIIGVNGAGKTSVLDAMALLAAAAGGGLGARLAQYGGLAETLTRDRAERLQINVTTTFAGESPIKYELALEPKGQGYWVHSECLSQERARPEPFKYLDSQNGHERYFDVEKKALVPLPVEGRPGSLPEGDRRDLRRRGRGRRVRSSLLPPQQNLWVSQSGSGRFPSA